MTISKVFRILIFHKDSWTKNNQAKKCLFLLWSQNNNFSDFASKSNFFHSQSAQNLLTISTAHFCKPLAKSFLSLCRILHRLRNQLRFLPIPVKLAFQQQVSYPPSPLATTHLKICQKKMKNFLKNVSIYNKRSLSKKFHRN